ncbi:MAG: SDR family oxidoreductase [Dehalococcoidia bacterium]|nr:SDR family oxidoreductase [Dehalococcoidia bacterium]
MAPDLASKRVLLLGAETGVGRAIAEALVAGGARLALVATGADAETAFAVQRLGRRLNAPAQAIDGGNEMAVRVMVRQVSKQLGGIDAAVFCADRSAAFQAPLALAVRYAARELARTHGTFVAVDVEPWEQPEGELRLGVTYVSVPLQKMPLEQAVARALHAVAGAADNR